MHFVEGEYHYTKISFCSQNEIYDIGTKILLLQSIGRNSMQKALKSIIFSGICCILALDYDASAKTRFKGILSKGCMRPWIHSLRCSWTFTPGGRLHHEVLQKLHVLNIYAHDKLND